MKKLTRDREFQIDIGLDRETGEWHIHVFSLSDKQAAVIKGKNFASLIKRAAELLKKKELFNRKFPLPEHALQFWPD